MPTSSTVSGQCSTRLIWSDSSRGRNGEHRKALTQSVRFDDLPFSNSSEFQILALTQHTDPSAAIAKSNAQMTSESLSGALSQLARSKGTTFM